MDTIQPYVSEVELSTDNSLSATLYDNQTGLAKTNEKVVLQGDNVTLKFKTSERVISPKVKINGLEKTATLQITGGSPDTTGTNWMASYEVQDNDTGLVVFKDFHATDPSGNFITYDNNSVRSPDNVTMDNRAPSVSSVELSTDNALAGTLYDDQNDTSKPHELVSRAGDKITLKFETDERVISPVVAFNGHQTNAILQTLNGSQDTTGMKWEAVYVVTSQDNGSVLFSFSGTDPPGNSIAFDTSTVLSPDNVTSTPILLR